MPSRTAHEDTPGYPNPPRLHFVSSVQWSDSVCVVRPLLDGAYLRDTTLAVAFTRTVVFANPTRRLDSEDATASRPPTLSSPRRRIMPLIVIEFALWCLCAQFVTVMRALSR